MPRRRSPPRLYLDETRGQWVIRDGPNFIRTGCSTKENRQAEIELAVYVSKKHKPERGPDPLITDALSTYYDEVAKGKKSVKNTEYNIASLVAWWGEKRVAQINPASCKDYSNSRSRAAARRDLEVLRAAINYYHKHHGPLSALPTVVLPAKSEPRERWLTQDEAKRLRRAAMRWPHLYRFIVVGLLTGSRSGAITSMEWSWVDTTARLLRRRGHGASEDSRKKTPTVRISRRLARLMRLWRRKDGKRQKYVIHYNGLPVKRLKRVWNEACKIAELDDVSPHTLRHTRATWLMQAGVDMWEAAGHLGMSVEILTKQYGKHHPNYQERASEV